MCPCLLVTFHSHTSNCSNLLPLSCSRARWLFGLQLLFLLQWLQFRVCARQNQTGICMHLQTLHGLRVPINNRMWLCRLPGCAPSQAAPCRKLTRLGCARAEHKQQWQHLPGHFERAVEPGAHRIKGALLPLLVRVCRVPLGARRLPQALPF